MMGSQKKQGRLIIFEGVDESGKTTVSQRLVKEIESRGQPCLWTAFPGHEPDTLGAEIYALHHDPRFALAPPLSIQLLHVAAHIEAIQQRILPALNSGHWVVLDRYWWSTWAYGIAANANATALRLALKIELSEWRAVRPALAFLLVRQVPNQKIQPPERVKIQRLYTQLARRERRQHPVEIVHNDSTLEEIVEHVISSTFQRLLTRR